MSSRLFLDFLLTYTTNSWVSVFLFNGVLLIMNYICHLDNTNISFLYWLFTGFVSFMIFNGIISPFPILHYLSVFYHLGSLYFLYSWFVPFLISFFFSFPSISVSYTHLDVYKRQSNTMCSLASVPTSII